jgi:hypothetical protein
VQSREIAHPIPASHRKRTWSEQFRPSFAIPMQARSYEDAAAKNGPLLFDVGMGSESWLTTNRLEVTSQ